MTARRHYYIFLFVFLAVIFLYIPFLNNALVFDDQGLFAGGIYDSALIPFDFRPRTFPYFTLGFIQVVNGTIEVNRIFSLCLHAVCSCVLFITLLSLLRHLWKLPSEKFDQNGHETRIVALAALGAIWFSIHPIAVYGAGYLAQRTILFSTFFSLLSLYFFHRAFIKNRTMDVITSAVFYSLAIFSKEHAIMLPLVALIMNTTYELDFQLRLKRLVIYVALFLPAATVVFLSTKHVVATGYEHDAVAIVQHMGGISIMEKSWGQWAVSMVLQTSFFFDYLAFWVVPDVRFLSADMRFDFIHMWLSWWVFPKAFLFIVSPVIAICFLRKKGLVALFCFGFLYCWVMFLTELVAVRFQEPFVLYRSYLWAPGYVMMLSALCAQIPIRWLMVTAVPLFVICFLLARDRLASLENEATLWKDAASKLESPLLIGSDRIFYNRGRAYLQEKKYDEARDDFSHAIQTNPRMAAGYYNRALASYGLNNDEAAMIDIKQAQLLEPKDFAIAYFRGMLLEKNGCNDAAVQAYRQSLDLGNKPAQLKIELLMKKDPIRNEHSMARLECPT